MSCTCKAFGNIANISNVKNYLLGEPDKLEFNDESWSWGVEESESSPSCWLEDSCFSLSPAADILAIANNKSLLVFTAKWDSQEEGQNKVKYLLKWQGDPRRDPTECVTSVLCLPIAANGRLSSAHFAPDWTAIAVGFDSGAVRFYTEGGALLVNEKFHNGPVRSLKCQTFIHTGLDVQDEFYVFYRSTVCLLPGIALTTSLTATRNQLTKVLAKAAEDAWEGPKLDCTKWELTDQASINDAQVLGKRCPTMLEHLVNASLEGGYLAQYSPAPLARYDVMAVGSRPFIALHSIREGTTTAPVLADVAKHVASKLIQMTSIGQAFPGWLGGGRRDSKSDSKEKTSMEPADPMTCRFGLADMDRKGERMVCCPYGKLAAVSDSFGRVTLIDTSRGMAVRMWKGYRQAQCAFIPVLEEKGKKRKSMFLAIYAPKKGIIQVWALQSGPMVATFQVSKNGRLHYSNYGLLNIPSITFKGNNFSQFPCVFLDEHGTLSVIAVPFHIVLSVMNDQKARDNHLIRQIRKVLENEGEVSEALELFEQINSTECVKQVLEYLVKLKRVTPYILRTFLDAITSRITTKDPSQSDEEPKTLTNLEEQILRSCLNLSKLLVLFEFFVNLKDQPPEYDSVVSAPSTSFETDRLRTLLRVNDKELESLVTSLSQFEDLVSKPRVRFEESGNSSLHSLLVCFLSTYSTEPPLRTDPSTNPQVLYLGELLCQGILYGSCSVDKWKTVIDDYINTEDLLHLALCYWLSKPHCQNIYNEVSNFADLIHAICGMTDSKEINFWWPEIRYIIKGSNNIPSALSAVYVMRAITIGVEEKLFDKGDGDWVTISEQSCIWSQMVEQLEAILVLQSAVRYKNKGDHTSLIPPIEITFPQISLSSFLTNGPGLVGELVAQWAGSWGLSVEWICDLASTRVQRRSLVIDSPSSPKDPPKGSIIEGSPEKTDASINALPVTPSEERALSILECLIEKFPYSLSADSLACNLAWEYSLAWTRDRNKLTFLDQVISAIKAISHPNIQHGICCLIWSTHICSTFEAAVRLMNKVGKVPKTRLSVQDIGIEDICLNQLLCFYISFLQLFIDSSLNSEVNQGPELEVENLWSDSDSPLSLAKVASTKTCNNRDLLHLKHQCAQALYLMTAFNTRFQNPVTSLFGPNGDILLMNDILNQTKVKSTFSGDDLDKSRTNFLKKIMTSIIEEIPEGVICKESIRWIGECYKLASDWMLPAEELRIHQVTTLYLFNHDNWAQDVVSSVNDKNDLGTQLLMVAGRRLKTMLSEPGSRVKETMVKLGPSLTTWLNQLEGCKCNNNLNSLKELATIIVTLVSDTSPDYVTADLLYEALNSL